MLKKEASQISYCHKNGFIGIMASDCSISVAKVDLQMTDEANEESMNLDDLEDVVVSDNEPMPTAQ